MTRTFNDLPPDFVGWGLAGDATTSNLRYQVHFKDGTTLEAPPALTPHGAISNAIECMAGLMPWDDHLAAISQALTDSMRVKINLCSEDHDHPLAALRELERGVPLGVEVFDDVTIHGVVETLVSEPPIRRRGQAAPQGNRVLRGRAAAKMLVRQALSDFSSQAQSLQHVGRVIQSIASHPRATAARSSTIWRVLNSQFGLATALLAARAAELGAPDVVRVVSVGRAPTGVSAVVEFAEMPDSWIDDSVADYMRDDAMGEAHRSWFEGFWRTFYGHFRTNGRLPSWLERPESVPRMN